MLAKCPQRFAADVGSRLSLSLPMLRCFPLQLQGFFHSLDQLDVEIIGKWLSKCFEFCGCGMSAWPSLVAHPVACHHLPAGYEFVPAGEPVYREGEFGESM